MPAPVNNNSSPSEFSRFVESATACDPAVASCPPTDTAPPTEGSLQPITIGPVYVSGDSNPATRELVRRFDASTPSGCAAAQSNAVVTCLLAATAAGTTVATAPSVIGFAMGLATTVGLATQCARDISGSLDCEERTRALTDANVDCADRGGILLNGASSELVCLVTP